MSKKTEIPKETKKKKLSLRQERFCQLYVSKDFFGNGTQAYIEAYEPDQSKKNWYNTARAVASEMLTRPSIYNRINELLDDAGFNDANADKQLLFVINQHADIKAKRAAIADYNKLKQRITDKVEHTLSPELVEALNKVQKVLND